MKVRIYKSLRCLIFASILFQLASAQTVTSDLWGVNGELWDPATSMLRDFTNVGYKGGTEPIPDWPVAFSVTDYGAIPDDNIDDTQAFLDAIAACPDSHAILVPAGKFTIAQKMVITKDNFVLRGEDMYESVLFFPKYYGEVYIEENGYSTAQSPIYEKFIQLEGGFGKSFENLTFKLREQRNKGAWEYEGAGFIDYKSNVTDSWIRNCVFLNFSSGMTVSATRTSFINLIFDQFNGRQGTDNASTKNIDGYGCILVRNCSYNLFHNIQIRSNGHYLQPIDLNESSSYNVYSQYRGNDQLNRSIGYHGGSSHFNLYTDMDLGVVRPREGDSRSDETYWNVNDNYLYSEVWEDVYLATNNLVFVGYGDQWPAKTTDPTLWYEPGNYGQVSPANIYLAQLAYFGEPLPEALPGPAPSRYEGDVFGILPDDNSKVDNVWYYRFDMSDAALTTVARARLRVHMDSARTSPPPYTFRAWSVTDDTWSDDTITTENKPGLIGELADRVFAHEDDDPVLEFDVTAFVQGELIGGDGVVSLAIDIEEAWKNNNLWSLGTGTKPELIIERVADPISGPPSAPQNIGTTPLIGNILLDWEDNAESDVTYTVYRNPYKVGADGTYVEGYQEYIDNGLVTSDIADIQSTMNWRPGRMYDGVVYKYKISAVDAHRNESERSKEIYAATLHPTNSPPAFADPISLANATAGAAYSENLASHASDPESDQLWFHMVSGPDWLEVSADGVLSGLPLWSDAGVYSVTFQVTAIGGSMQKTMDIEVVLPPDNPPGPPSAPTSLTAATGENSIILNWSDSAEADWNAYIVYRSTISGSGYTELESRQTLSDFIDATTVNDVTYYYVVTAVDSNGNESTLSNEVSAYSVSDLTPPAVPAGSWVIPTADSILLQWSDNVESDLASYNIYRSTVSGSPGVLVAAGVTTPSYNDADVVDGTTYYYTITATDTSGNESAQSSEIIGTYDSNVKTVWVGEATDNIWDAVHWSAGLPDRSDNEGTMSRDALWDASTSTLVDYYLNVTGGTITGTSFTIFFTFEGGQQTLSGGSVDTTGKTLEFSAGAVATLENVNSSITAGRVFLDTASLTLNDGTITAGQLYFKGTASFIMNGGTADFTAGDALIGAQSFGGGSVQLNGGDLTAGNLIFASAWDLTLGGTTAGSAEFTSGFGGMNHNDSLIDINWLPGSQMGLIVAGADWAALWNDGRMTYNGNDYTTLGNWAQVTAADGLAPDVRFDYDIVTNTLSLSSEAVVNNPPAFIADPITLSNATSGVLYSGTIGGQASDPESDPMTFSKISGPDWLSVSANGDLSGTPDNGVAGLNTFIVGVSATGGSDAAALHIDVIAAGDSTPPAAPVGLSATAGENSVSLDWDDNSELDLSSYSVYRSTTAGSYSTPLISGLTTSAYDDITAVNGTTYYYVVTATDTNNNESSNSSEVSATPEDMTPPAAPTGLVATGDQGFIGLNWNDNGESDLAGYLVYRSTSAGTGYVLVSEQTASDYVDSQVANGTLYYYVVTAIDSNGNESPNSLESSAQTGEIIYYPDFGTEVLGSTFGTMGDVRSNNNLYQVLTEDAYTTGAPTTRLSYLEYVWTFEVSGGSSVTFMVEAHHDTNSEGDDFAFAYSFDGINFTNMLTVTKTSDDNTMQQYSLPPETDGTVYVRVVDTDRTARNTQADSLYVDHMYIVTVLDEDLTPLAAPTGLTASPLENAISLNWDDNNEAHLLNYKVSRSTVSGSGYTLLGYTLGAVSAYTDNTVEPGIEYFYVVSAVDFNTNESPISNEASATPTDSATPDAPADLTATAGEGSVALDWTDNVEGDLAGYVIYRSTTSGSGYGLLGNSASVSAYTDTTAVNGSTYYYVVTAVDTEGNESAQSSEVSATPQDTSAPAAPTGLAATSGDGSVSLDWTGNVEADLASYKVYRSETSGSGYALLGNTGNATSGYTDSTAENGTEYFYVVSAVDSSSNESAQSLEASATPLDATAPAAPAGLVATPGDGLVSLDWENNTEGDLVSYSVYRSETPGSGYSLLDNSGLNSAYIDSTVENGTTYYYVVTASDGTGNESDPSVEASATPQALSGNSLISGDIGVATNWTAGILPVDPASPGIINALNVSENQATIPDTTARTGLVIRQTGGELAFTGFGTSAFDDVEYEIAGGIFISTSFGHKILNSSVFDVSGGTVNVVSFGLESSSTLNVSSGTMSLSGNLTTKASVLNFSGGSVSVGGNAIAAFNSGTLNLSGDVIFNVTGQMGVVHFGTSSTVNIGQGDGSISVGTLEVDSMTIDWASGSGFSLTVNNLLNAGAAASWPSLWDSGQLTYNAQDFSTLGDWSAVTAPGGLDGTYAFAFDSDTGTLSLVESLNSDSDGDGIADSVEMLEFGSIAHSDGSADSDGDGVIDFFEYLYGSSMNDGSDSGFSFTSSTEGSGGGFSVEWAVQDSMRLSEHYTVYVSTNLSQWDVLPPEHYTLTEVSNGNKTDVLLEVTHDYGSLVFLKLMAP